MPQVPRVPGRTLLTLAVVAVAVTLATLWFHGVEWIGSSPITGRDARDTSTTGSASADEAATADSESAANTPVRVAPTADEVVADPNCRMVVGQRSVSDIALVILPLGDGAWFAVVDGDGVEFDGTLPFVPDRHALGKRGDGSILAGLGFEDELRIVRDGLVIYEFDAVWDFDIANNGSSFFVVEPLAGGASRLIVRNLDLREEHHFDLDTQLTRGQDGRLNAVLSYSTYFSEVAMAPALNEGGTNRFYGVAGGYEREVVVGHRQSMLPKDLSIFASSGQSYHAHNVGDAPRHRLNLRWRIVKVEREFGAGEQRPSEVWARDLEFLGFLQMHLSENGDWLLLSDLLSGVEVLDTTTGETVFTQPRRRDIRLTMLRYGGLVDRTERFGGRMVGDRLFVVRYLEDEPDEFDVRVLELDRNNKGVRDVGEFKLTQGVDESEQSFAIRTELDPEAPTSCTDHVLLDRRLEVRDGRLTYRTGTDYETSR